MVEPLGLNGFLGMGREGLDGEALGSLRVPGAGY